MAYLTVTTQVDVVDPGDGQLSLREAVAQANFLRELIKSVPSRRLCFKIKLSDRLSPAFARAGHVTFSDKWRAFLSARWHR
jgi:hypothetical protein